MYTVYILKYIFFFIYLLDLQCNFPQIQKFKKNLPMSEPLLRKSLPERAVELVG